MTSGATPNSTILFDAHKVNTSEPSHPTTIKTSPRIAAPNTKNVLAAGGQKKVQARKLNCL